MSGDSEQPRYETQSPATTTRYTRSRQMANVLREEFLYSEKRVRDILFREVGASYDAGGPPRTVSRLAREVAARGREQAQAGSFELLNWDIAAKATLNAMLGAGVLLDVQRQPIPLTIAAQATEVSALAPGYVDRTEAYLLEVVIRKLGDVTARDHTALAHALFRQFDRNVPMEELEDRVVTLLASLADRIGLAKGGTYFPLPELD